MKICMWNVIPRTGYNKWLPFVNLKMVQIMQNNSKDNAKKATSVCKKFSIKQKLH